MKNTKKKPSKKTENFFKTDSGVLKSKKKYNDLLKEKEQIDGYLQDNLQKITGIKNLINEDLSEVLTLKSLHDDWAIKNKKKVFNSMEILNDISKLRKKQYKDVESLFKSVQDIKISEIDLAISKIDCLFKKLNKKNENIPKTFSKEESDEMINKAIQAFKHLEEKELKELEEKKLKEAKKDNNEQKT